MKKQSRWRYVAAGAALALALSPGAAVAQKSGGVLKIPHGDSPASMSIHEESTIVSEGPMMAVFNNLVMFDQHTPQNRLDTIVPDLGVEWSWSEDGTTPPCCMDQPGGRSDRGPSRSYAMRT